jgi:hypothetical protein
VCVAAGLASCAYLSSPEEDTDLDLAAAAEPAPPPEPPEAAPEVEEQTQIAVIPVRKPQGSLLDPEALIGSNEAEVTEALGLPNDTRTEAPATIWRYGDNNCGLDLYYYLDVSGNSLRVLNYQVRTAENGSMTPRDCLRRLNQGT